LAKRIQKALTFSVKLLSRPGKTWFRPFRSSWSPIILARIIFITSEGEISRYPIPVDKTMIKSNKELSGNRWGLRI
jgi:hypothetical protein